MNASRGTCAHRLEHRRVAHAAAGDMVANHPLAPRDEIVAVHAPLSCSSRAAPAAPSSRSLPDGSGFGRDCSQASLAA